MADHDHSEMVDKYVRWLRDVKYPGADPEAWYKRVLALGFSLRMKNDDEGKILFPWTITHGEMQAIFSEFEEYKETTNSIRPVTTDHVQELLKDVPAMPRNTKLFIPKERSVEGRKPLFVLCDLLSDVRGVKSITLNLWHTLLIACFAKDFLTERPDSWAVDLCTLNAMVPFCEFIRVSQDHNQFDDDADLAEVFREFMLKLITTSNETM